jgi:PAS domain S-box-containing protein
VRAFEVGGADYIIKPFQVEEVLARIEHQLTIRRTQAALRRSEAELRQANAELEQRIAERTAELRQNQTLFQGILDHIPAAIYVKDLEGRYILANTYLLHLLSMTPEQMIGKTEHELFPPETIANWQNTDQQVIDSGESFVYEEIISTQEGTLTYLITKFPLRDERAQVYATGGIALDITRRKETEEAYRTLVDHSLQGLIIFQDGQIVFANHAMANINGYTIDEMLTWGWDEFNRLVHPEDQDMLWAYLRDRLAGKPVPERYEYRIVRKDGVVRWLEAHGAIIRYRGRPASQGMYLDITERKDAENRLQRYACELEQRETEALQLAYIVSHDLRAPLINLKGFTAEISTNLESMRPILKTALPHLNSQQRADILAILNEDAPESLHFITAAVDRMDNLIAALLKLSRLGRRELHMQHLDMHALVAGTLHTLAHQIEAQHVHIHIEPLPPVVADQTAMEQIMGNILNNAVRYLDPARQGYIHISGKATPTSVTYAIRDNGRGIAPEQMDSVFAPFRRAGEGEVPGEGMGLAYVKTLVRRHNGLIVCESEPGVGTTFLLTLPCQIEEPPAS